MGKFKHNLIKWFTTKKKLTVLIICNTNTFNNDSIDDGRETAKTQLGKSNDLECITSDSKTYAFQNVLRDWKINS